MTNRIERWIERLLDAEARAGSRECRARTRRGKIAYLRTHRARHALRAVRLDKSERAALCAWHAWRASGWSPDAAPPVPPPARAAGGWRLVAISNCAAAAAARHDPRVVARRVRAWNGGQEPVAWPSRAKYNWGSRWECTMHRLDYLSAALVSPTGRVIAHWAHGRAPAIVRAPAGYVWRVDDVGLALVREADGVEYHPGPRDDVRAAEALVARIDEAARRRAERVARDPALARGWATASILRAAGACDAGLRWGAERVRRLLRAAGAEVVGDLVADGVAVRREVVEVVAPEWARRLWG